MPIATTDKRLLEGTRAAIERSRGLALSGQPAAIRDIAVQVLEGAHGALKSAVSREDAEEVEKIEAEAKLEHERGTLNEAFTRLYLGLHSGVLARRLEGDSSPAVADLAHYLEAQNPSGFSAAGLDLAVATLERARGFGERFLPEAVRDAVLSFAGDALERTKRALEKLRKEGTEAVQALADLERAREAAREGYLAARDLVSAALRLSRQHDKLSQVMPGLHDVLQRGAPAAKPASEEPAPTTPEPKEEPKEG